MPPAFDSTHELVGHFHAWWHGDPLPAITAPVGLSIQPVDTEQVGGEVGEIDAEKTRYRMSHGHRPWVARIGSEVVGWGWCATEEAEIGELGISFSIPAGNRYLWDFVTVPHWRGRRIYPALLRAIMAFEADVQRFWLGHDSTNVASARGIAVAGFQEVGALHRRGDGALVLVPKGSRNRAVAAATLFGLSPPDSHGASWPINRR